MRKTIFFLMVGALAFGCADKKAQEQSLRDSVVDVHERVMGEDEKMLADKSALDTLIKQTADKLVKDSAKIYSDKLALADSDMMTWMHNFNPDQSNQPHDAVMSYFGKQKRQIVHIDSQMTGLLKETSAYLDKTKKK